MFCVLPIGLSCPVHQPTIDDCVQLSCPYLVDSEAFETVSNLTADDFIKWFHHRLYGDSDVD